MRQALVRPTLAVALLLALASCSSDPSTNAPSPSEEPPVTHPASASPSPAAPIPASQHSTLNNTFRLTPTILSGGQPETDAEFEALLALGVRTIVSVDGSSPNIACAHRHGLHYIHIPVGYDGLTPEQQLLVAKAVDTYAAPNHPVYIHCHHGLHRGPAAAASAAIELGYYTPEQGLAFLKEAHTSHAYPGLFTCVEHARKATYADLHTGTPATTLPELSAAKGTVANMVEMDEIFDTLKQIEAAGWKVPKNHPDVVPAAQASRLTDILRRLSQDPPPSRVKDVADFRIRMKKAAANAQAFELHMTSNADPAALSSSLKLLGQSCNDCHAKYRNR